MKRVGVIINPIAGMGGSVGLKGSDGLYEEALRRGAVPQAEARMREALLPLLQEKEAIAIYTGGGPLGEALCKRMGFPHVVVFDVPPRLSAETTRELCRRLDAAESDLILFAGGDGTARDVSAVLRRSRVALGVPAGVKMHSPVYATSPAVAGRVAASYLRHGHSVEAEVIDLDENRYRKGMVETALYGYLTIPLDVRGIQSRKSPSPRSEAALMEGIAARVVEEMEPEVYYLIGAGSTTRAIMERLSLPYTLLGVDLIQNKSLLRRDVYGEQIQSLIGAGKVRLITTIVGGQGFLFGRGNQQLTAPLLAHIGKEHISIVATRDKILQLAGRDLLIDTGDAALDKALSGYYRITVSYGETLMYRAACPGGTDGEDTDSRSAPGV